MIGFAGPRVIEQTIRQKLPQGFQRSEFLLEHGMLDAVVHRKQLKAYISRALDFMAQSSASAVSRQLQRSASDPASVWLTSGSVVVKPRSAHCSTYSSTLDTPLEPKPETDSLKLTPTTDD